MLVAAGFLNNLVLEAEGRQTHSGQGAHRPRRWTLVEDSPQKEVHRERLVTTVVALDLDGGHIDRHRSPRTARHRLDATTRTLSSLTGDR